MITSLEIQDWAGNKTPWHDVPPDIHVEEINETTL